MDRNFNSHNNARKREFLVSDKIFLKHCQSLKQSWVPGEVSKKLGSVLYEVVVDSGQKHIRHVNQLRPRFSLANPLFECAEAKRVQEEVALVSPRNNENVAQTGRAFHHNGTSPPTPDLRLSIRIRQPSDKKVHNTKEQDWFFSRAAPQWTKLGLISNCVTLSGILNALDGVASSEKRIIFMTTNHKDKLDSALVRPGRVDCEQYIGHCTEDMLDRMFRRFYKDASQEQCQSFLKLASAFQGGISPAMVQRHFIRYMEDPESAIKNFSEIK